MHSLPNRRFIVLTLLLSAALALTFISFFRGLPSDPHDASYSSNDLLDSYRNSAPFSEQDIAKACTVDTACTPDEESKSDTEGSVNLIPEQTLTGAPVASKLGNETAKAELGRAAWKLFHTTFARFPDNPSQDEQSALRAYIYLFARMYPCGECAQHFSSILSKFPPQVSSRSAGAAWGCHVHNQVNKELDKEQFDCSKIGDFYKCGCADEDEDGGALG